jgi:hypothetical protein
MATTNDTDFVKEIKYNRANRDYDAYLDGEYKGSFSTYHTAEVALDQIVFDILEDTRILTTDQEAENALCSCGAPAVLLVHEGDTEHRVCDPCFQADFENDHERSTAWTVEPLETLATQECTVNCPGCEACAVEPPAGPESDPVPPWPACPGNGFAPCGNPATVDSFCPRCATFLDKVFVAAMTERALDTVRPAPRQCPICNGDHDVQRCPRIWLKLRDPHVPAHIAVLIHRVQTAPCQHSEPLVWEAERLYRLRNTLVCLAIGGDGDAWQRLLDMSARAHTRLLRRMEAATAASKTRMAELNAQLGIQWLAA